MARLFFLNELFHILSVIIQIFYFAVVDIGLALFLSAKASLEPPLAASTLKEYPVIRKWGDDILANSSGCLRDSFGFSPFLRQLIIYLTYT